MYLKVSGAAFDAMNKISTNTHFKTMYTGVTKHAFTVKIKTAKKLNFHFLHFFSRIESVELMEVLIGCLSLFL